MNTRDRSVTRSRGCTSSLALLAVVTACADGSPSSSNAGAGVDAAGARESPATDAGPTTDASPSTDASGADASSGGDAGATDAQGPRDAGPPPSAHDLYVAVTGSDSNPGTQAAPFKTIQKAAQVAPPDTTVHVGQGTYAQNVVTSANGTSVGRIRYVSEVRWKAIVVGSGTESTWSNHGDYVDIVGFDVTGSGRGGILNYGSFVLVAGNHVHDLAVSGGCTGNGGAGIVNADYTKSDDDIIGNVVHDIGVPGACNGVQGIYHANLRGRVENNIVYRASAFGIHLWHAANAVKIANNTVFANGSASMGGGIVIGSGDSPGGVVVDNTIVANNIVVHNPAASIVEYCYAGVSCIGASNKVVANLVFGNGSAISLRVGTHSGTVLADPMFVSYQADGTGDYHLMATSPAIDNGSSTYGALVDFEGNPRPYGARVDIGAFEWHP